MATPGPVKIGHKKDGHQRQPDRFHVSRPPAAGSATDLSDSLNSVKVLLIYEKLHYLKI